ncbi:hypothetical protein G9Q86_08620 [Pseudomonas sp. CCUG 57209]|uniref:hypothetical protein n=1 Tax=Pseudomonas sivasensis TaxID=1880678 RepID=UPI0015EB4923|nr:hypothetical protein [Pseudomonas sivasensis]MBA2928634.1 hypothetical protein [Pseudomonas sivasensis]
MLRTPKKNVGCTADERPSELYFQNLGTPLKDDSETDKCIGLRHVEHDLNPILFHGHTFALDTEIFLYWNSPTPEDFLVIDEGNVYDPMYILNIAKENILPGRATAYCTIWEPGESPVDTDSTRIRIKLNRPGNEDPDPDKKGHQGLVFFIPEDLEAGAVIDAERAKRGVVLDVQPYENMAEFDTCRIAWGSRSISHVVMPREVGRGFQITVTNDVIHAAGSDPFLPIAMQVIDAVGNYPVFDPESDANWSPPNWVNVNLGTRLLEAPFLEQPGDVIDLKRLGAAPQKIKLFLHPEVFDIGDRVRLDWEGRDEENFPVPYSDEKTVERTTSFMEFDIPNERVRALGGGAALLSCSLHRLKTNDMLVSMKARVTVRGAAGPWQAPQVQEATAGYLDPAIAKATVTLVAPDGWEDSTQIRLVWVGGSVAYIQEYTLATIPTDRILVFTVDGEHIKRFNTLLTELYYVRADRPSSRESLRMQIQVGKPGGALPQARVESADAEQQVMVTLPFTETEPGDIVTLQWISDESRTTVPNTLDSETAGRALYAPIDIGNLKDGDIVRVYYSLRRGGQPTLYSKLLVWVMGLDGNG